MFPVIHVVFAALGALLGAGVAPRGEWRFAVLVGACIGYAVAELSSVRGRLLLLEADIAKLRASLRRRDVETPAPSQSPQQAPAEMPAQAPAEMPAPAPAARASAPPPASVSAPVTASAPARVTESQLDPLDELRRDERSNAEPPAPATGVVRSSAARPGISDIPIVNAVRQFFTGANSLVRAGVIVLFFGVAFLLRYVAEHSRVPIEFRLAGVAAGAMALLALGWSLRKSRPGYALALQGGAVGILYLIVFAALHLYSLLPASTAFGVLAVLAMLSAILAVLQNSMAFALLAVTGGFLAPILASTGAGNHVVLFSYYAVVNSGIVAIAWFKAWRPLNLAGFVFTFVIGTVWGVLRYRAEDFATTEPFLVLFFLFYVAVAVLFT